MKKTFFCFMLLAIGNFANAQVSFGLKGGIQHNILRASDGGSSNIGIMGTGAHLAFIADYSVNEKFSIQPNLLFQMKTVKSGDESSIAMYAADLPINFLYKEGGFFAGAGPNFSFGLSAKTKTDGEEDQDLYEDPEGPEEAALKRLEIGANILMGYRFSSGLTLSAHYTPGLSNILNNATGDQKYNTRVFGFSIGYMIK